MFDIGFDWHELYRNYSISRSALSPFFTEAGSLLCSTSHMWQGRAGKGRVVGNEIFEIGRRFANAGQDWMKNALAWADANPAPILPGPRVGHILRAHADHRSFSLMQDIQVKKSAIASYRLTDAVIRIVEARIPLLEKTGRSYETRSQIEEWEDTLERLGESPASKTPKPPTCDAGINLLENRAIFRACEGLAGSMSSIIQFASNLRKRKNGIPSECAPWSKAREKFRRAAKDAYLMFINGCPEEERSALASVRDDAHAYGHFGKHFATREEVEKCGIITSLLINLLLKAIDEKFSEWMAGVSCELLDKR